VPGRPADYRHAHPQRPALAVEVSDSSLRFDPRSTDGGTGQSRRWRRRLSSFRSPSRRPASWWPTCCR